MSKKAVFCIADTTRQAERIITGLKTLGFSNTDISALFPDREGRRDFGHEKGSKAPEGAATGAGGGALLCGALGWLAGIGTLVIPGLAPLLAAGPLLAALSAAAIGGMVGGLTGALIGLGMPEYEAKRYEGKISEGNILLSVHTDTSEQIKKAKTVFEENDAQDIAVAGEAAVVERKRDTLVHPGTF